MISIKTKISQFLVHREQAFEKPNYTGYFYMSQFIASTARFQSERGRIELVEVARGLAALAVTLLHAANNMAAEQYSGRVGFDGLFRLGFLGVDFFFVLSGFIILFVHYNDINTPQKAKRYIWRRLVRIFPTYWIIFAIFLTFNLLVQRSKADITGFTWFFGELFLLKDHLWLALAWTLQHEMMFYMIFVLLILNRNIGLGVFLLWMASIIAVKLISPDFHNYTLEYLTPPNPRMPFQIFLHPINFDFLFGMSVAWATCRRPSWLPILSVCYGLIFLLVGQFYFQWSNFDWNDYGRYPWVGTGFASLLAAVVILSQYLPRIPAALTFLGTISYSLYLCHLLPTGIVYASLARLGWYQALPEVLIFMLAVGSSITFSGLCYYFLEKPIMQRLQKLVT